jgi:1,4-dihydroxy-6-naphthoate synthase
MKLTLGFSPCPNDTFIFDALVNKKIDTGDFEFKTVLADVQTLNQWALQGSLDISKISYGVLPLILNNYNLLDAGGALGKGVGPLLIAKKEIPHSQINDCVIAVPGKNTTAHLLFSLAFPKAKNKQFIIFSEIEDAVLSGKADCGVIIHENRFTYQQKGLIKLIDLGEFWEDKTGCPIPLGGIVMNKKHDNELQKKINSLIKKSVEYAFSNYPLLPGYVKQHSQEMDEHVMRQHIDLYVNNYSIRLGDDGRNAVETLLKVYAEINNAEQIKPASFAG